jgi:hypothetical protein
LAQEARAAAEAAPEPEPELMEVERREPIPPFEQQRVIRDRIEAEIENQILQGLEKRANDLTTPEMRERERARLEATIRPTVEREYGQVYTPGVGLTTPPTQGGFIPFFRPSRIAEQPDGTRLYRDPATGELREPTPGEELFESFAQQQILSEQEVQQAALMGEAPEEGFGILQRVEPGFGVYEAPLSAALRGIGGGLLALGDEAYAAIDFTVTPEAADEAERLRKESWEVLLPGNEVEGESYWERYGRSRDLNNQAEDVLLQGAVDPSEAGYKMAQLRRRLGIPDTMAHPTIRYVQVPIPFGQARVQAPTEAFEADPRRERERSEAPELTRRVGQNIAAGRTISNAVLEMPMTSGFYDAVWGDPEAGALLTMGGEAILPIGPGTAYRGVRSASGATSALRRSLENLKLEEAGHRIMEMGRFTRAAPPAPDAVSTARALPVDDPALSPSTQRLLDLGLLRRSRAPSPTTVPEPRVSLRGSDGKVGAPAIGLDTTVPLDEYIVRRLSRRLALATGAARRAGTGAAAPTLPTGAARAVPSRPSTTARAATTTGAARRAGTEPVQRLDTAYNRALATAAEAAATTGDYMRVVYRAARGDVVNPIVAKKVAERVLRSAGLEEDLISRAVKAIRPASATFNDVWTDISRSLVRKVEGGGEVFALDVPTMQRIERGLKLGIPDDYVMITDDIAVPRSIAGDLRDRASRFAQSQILRDQSSKWMYLDRVINTYAGKVDSKLINRLRRLRDGARDKRNIRISEGIETLTDGLSGEIAKRDKLVIAALEDIRAAAVALAKADPEINATQAANIGRRLVEGYRYRPMNEIQQTLRSALREGIPVARSFDELDLSKRELVVERLKEHFITQQAGNLARNTMDVGAMQLYLDRSIKGFSNLLDFRALNTPFSRQLMALFGRKLDDTTKFSVDMANLLRRAGRGRAREIARLVEEQARTVNAHITATLQGVKDARRASQRSLDEARRAARKARYPEAARAAERRVAREEAEAAELATRLDQTVADVLAVQRRLDESGTAVAAIEMLLDRMARASRLPPEQIWEQVFSTMFNPKLNRQILKQALEEAGVGEVFVRYPTVETINTVARVAQDIPQVRWAGRTTPFTNDAVKHLLAAMMDGPIREAAARGIITREVQRKINLAPYFREAMEKNKGLADAVFDPEIGAKIEENSRVLGMTFPVDRPLGASRITPGVDTEFERVIAQGGGEFLELLNYVQPKYRASLGGLALQAGQYLLQQGQMGIRQAAKYGYAVPNVPFLIYKRLEMPFVAATQVGVSDAIKGFQKSSLAQYVRNQILRRNTTGGGITTPEGVYYSPSDLARLAEQEGIGYTAVEAERVGLAMTDMIQDINQR